MRISRWWSVLRTSVIANAFGIAALGMGQFALTSVRRPGYCAGISSPWSRLCYWFQSGRHEPLSAYFDGHESHRLVGTTLAVIVLGGLLAWSIRAGWPLRLRPSLRVRTLMIAIAIAAFASIEGREAWAIWQRWDNYSYQAEHWASMEEIGQPDPSDPPEDAAISRQLTERYRREKEKYRRAMWRPWRDVEPGSFVRRS